MNCAYLIKEDLLTPRFRTLLEKNGCGSISELDKPEQLAEIQGEEAFLVIYQWRSGDSEELNELNALRKAADSEKTKILLIVEENMGREKTLMAKSENTLIISKPLSLPRLQAGLKMLLSPAPQDTPLEVKFLRTLLKVTPAVVRKMGKSEITEKEISTVPGFPAQGDLSAAMKISGMLDGYVLIGMAGELAFNLINGMTGGSVKSYKDPTLESGIMEFLNVISGQAQAGMDKTILAVDFDTPVFFKDGKNPLSSGAGENSIVVRFEGEKEKSFFLQLTLKGSG